MSKECVYGFPCVENPHDFTPDHECCTETEIAAWEEAKRQWDAGNKDAAKNDGCEWVTPNLHVCKSSWGIGVNMVDMDEMFAEASHD